MTKREYFAEKENNVLFLLNEIHVWGDYIVA